MTGYDTSIYDNLPVTVVIYEKEKDADGKVVDYRIVYGNNNFANDYRRLYGSDEFLEARAVANHLVDEYTLSRMASFEGKEVRAFSTYIPHANLHVHMEPVTDLPDGYIGFVISDIEDFSEQESRVQFLRVITQMNNNGCLLLQGKDGRLTMLYATPAFSRMMGCASKEEAREFMDGDGFLNSTYEEDRPQVLDMLKNRVGADGTQDLTIRKVTRSGDIIWCTIHYAFIDEYKESYVYCTYAEVTKFKKYENQLQSIYSSLGRNFYKDDDKTITRVRANLTQNRIEEATGVAHFFDDADKFSFTEALNKRIRYIPIKEEQELFLETFGIQPLAKAYMDGNVTASKVLYSRLPDDTVSYVKFTANVTRHPLSGDVVAFITEELCNPEKLAMTIQDKILARQFDLVAYIARDRYDVAIGDSTQIEHGNIFPAKRSGSYREYLEKQILPALRDDEHYREEIRQAMSLETVFRMFEVTEPYSVDIEVSMDDGVFYKRFDFYSVEPQSEYCIVLKSDTTQLRLEQKRQEERARELEYSKQELADAENIIADAGFGMWHIVLEDGRRPRMRGNGKMMELLGIDDPAVPEEEIYDFWYSRINPEDMPSVEKSVGEMLDGQASENTYRWEHPKWGWIYARCGGTAKKLDEHKVILRGYHSDVTDTVQEDMTRREALSNALAAAENANRAKTTFLNNMSHDIRTPMNAIVGFTTLASSHIDDKQQVRDYLGKISVSSQHLLSLINDVLDMSRIESGKMTLDEGSVNLTELVNDLRTITQANVADKQLQLHIDMSSVRNENIVTDKLKLNQVFLNILSNAIKFTPEGGKIFFTVREEPSPSSELTTYEFRIRDTGIGMSKEFRDTIFDAFTREKTSTISGIQGTGLGMAITKSIVDMMGGSIHVESEPGEGTEFIVSIPCRLENVALAQDQTHEASDAKAGIAAAETLTDDPADDATESRDFTGRRILLAEDNEMNQMIAEAILTEAGFTLDIAENGKQVVDTMEKTPAGTYDIILMDIQMPVMDGYEAARIIRGLKDEEKAKIPIIAVTANAFEEDRRLALEAGMNGHLAKPYDIPKMLQMLSMLLR